MQIAGLLNGKNINYDYQFWMVADAVLPSEGAVVFGLAVTAGSVAAGRAIIRCTRTNWQVVMVAFTNTTAYTIDTTGSKKVWVEVSLTKLDDGSTNAADGTGIATINTGASYPASNYIALASITSGTITDARPLWIKPNEKSANIASATTTDLATCNGHEVHVTGTATITSLGIMKSGTEFCLIFDGACTLTHSANLDLPGSANITTAAGDTGYFVSEGAGAWKCTGYQKKDWTPVSSAVNIGSLSESFNYADWDFFIDYNSTDAANRKIKAQGLRSQMDRLGGDGSDGALSISTGTTTITLTNDIVEKNYASISITGGTLAISGVSSNNWAIAYIKCKGDFTMSAGAITMDGQGAAGGGGGVVGYKAKFIDYFNTIWNGGNLWNAWTTSGWVSGGASVSPVTLIAPRYGRRLMLSTWNWGGGGGAGAAGVSGGTGWRGGGLLIIEVGGRINFTGGTISANGLIGTTPWSPSGGGGAGGGGGGSGWSIVVLYNESVATSWTLQVNGGAGAQGWPEHNGGSVAGGGGGGSGGAWPNWGAASGAGGTGGAGGANGGAGAAGSNSTYGTGGAGGAAGTRDWQGGGSGGGGGGGAGFGAFIKF